MLSLLFTKGKLRVIRLNRFIQWIALFFGIGAIISTFSIPPDAPIGSFGRALSVLPNYLYWTLLILFLVSNRKLLNLSVIYKGVFWGVVASVLYYVALKDLLRILPVFSRMTPNGFSFILICYTPIALYYLMQKRGKAWALGFLSILVFVLLQDGRRAGVVLVMLSGLAVIYAAHLNWKNIIAFILVAVGLFFLLRTPVVKQSIAASSERVYNLLYESEKITTEDKSFLTRVAMVRKGLAIYDKYPYTGIGLNNFTNYSIPFDTNFEGSKFLAHKRHIQSTSSHNSYVVILAEGGLFLFIPFVVLIGMGVGFAFFRYFSMVPDVRPIYIGMTAMAVHFYFITAIVNVYAWFLIGLACAYRYRR